MLDYDADNRLEQLSHKAAHAEVSVTPLAQYNYDYDDASRIKSIDSMIDGPNEIQNSPGPRLAGDPTIESDRRSQ